MFASVLASSEPNVHPHKDISMQRTQIPQAMLLVPRRIPDSYSFDAEILRGHDYGYHASVAVGYDPIQLFVDFFPRLKIG